MLPPRLGEQLRSAYLPTLPVVRTIQARQDRPILGKISHSLWHHSLCWASLTPSWTDSTHNTATPGGYRHPSGVSLSFTWVRSGRWLPPLFAMTFATRAERGRYPGAGRFNIFRPSTTRPVVFALRGSSRHLLRYTPHSLPRRRLFSSYAPILPSAAGDYTLLLAYARITCQPNPLLCSHHALPGDRFVGASAIHRAGWWRQTQVTN